MENIESRTESGSGMSSRSSGVWIGKPSQWSWKTKGASSTSVSSTISRIAGTGTDVGFSAAMIRPSRATSCALPPVWPRGGRRSTQRSAPPSVTVKVRLDRPTDSTRKPTESTVMPTRSAIH